MRRLLTISLVCSLLPLTSCSDLKCFAYEGFGGRDAWQQPQRVVELLQPQ